VKLALLFLATLSVMLLPMLPALVEWLRPSDVQPLPIDEADALDPPYLARSFAARLAEAVAAGAARLGSTAIVACPAADESPPLDAAERAAQASHRLWHAAGELRLPDGMAFYAEVAAAGGLRTAERGVYKALWAGGALRLAAQASVLRWAHGDEVFVGEGCHLAGRVTAERLLVLAPGASFMLLHAPCLRFLPQTPRPTAAAVPGDGAALAGVRWDASGRRAIRSGALTVAAGTAWQGDLVCHGDLVLGPRCAVGGSLKVRGRLVVGPGCSIAGNVFAEGQAELGAGCFVQGVLMSELAIALDTGCTLGAPASPTTVAAPRIDIGAGVEIHGTVWAEAQGRCVAAPVPAAAEAQFGAQAVAP
jgi:cytoskeletal protein CcmA (bactofilin family)